MIESRRSLLLLLVILFSWLSRIGDMPIQLGSSFFMFHIKDNSFKLFHGYSLKKTNKVCLKTDREDQQFDISYCFSKLLSLFFFFKNFIFWLQKKKKNLKNVTSDYGLGRKLIWSSESELERNLKMVNW